MITSERSVTILTEKTDTLKVSATVEDGKLTDLTVQYSDVDGEWPFLQPLGEDELFAMRALAASIVLACNEIEDHIRSAR